MNMTNKLDIATACLIFCLLVHLLSFPAIAREPDDQSLKFDRVLDLGSELTSAILQDSNGFLWIGTVNGLVRYDGYDVKWYKPGPGSLSGGMVSIIVQDAIDPAVLWVGTSESLERFDTRTETFRAFLAKPNDPDSLPDQEVISIDNDISNPNILWIVTGGGLSRLNTRKETFIHYLPDPDDPHSISGINAEIILDDPHDPDTLWVGTWGSGLNKLNKTSGTFTHYRHDPADPHTLSDPKELVYWITQDEDESEYQRRGDYHHDADFNL